ncbi:hypothetical protein C8Q73DRAFT_664780 [Cubamyces lactineus]|nr:hypothetical protein C8Q73DRAFT_664780 [Cubamyces lactineus]
MALSTEDEPTAPIPPLIDDNVSTPPTHTAGSQETETDETHTATASTFAQLLRRPTEPATLDALATPAGSVEASKGKQRAEAIGQPLSSPSSIAEDLVSVNLTEHTGRTNIPAIKQDVRKLATHVDKELQSYAAQQSALQVTVMQLTEIVSTLRPTAPSATFPGPIRALQDRVKRMAQHFERLDDQRGAELDDLREQASSLRDDTTVIIQGVGKLTALVNNLRSEISVQKANALVQEGPVALPPTPSTLSRGRSPSPFGGPSTPRQHNNRGRQYGHMDGRPYKRPRPLAPLSDPSSISTTPQQSTPVSPIVRFGSITWSAQPDSLKREVRASARGAWDALPGVFENIVPFALDARDQTYMLLRFASPYLAQAFVDAWVQHKHKTPATQKARAETVVA